MQKQSILHYLYNKGWTERSRKVPYHNVIASNRQLVFGENATKTRHNIYGSSSMDTDEGKPSPSLNQELKAKTLSRPPKEGR